MHLAWAPTGSKRDFYACGGVMSTGRLVGTGAPGAQGDSNNRTFVSRKRRPYSCGKTATGQGSSAEKGAAHMATTKTLTTKELTPFVGAEVLDVDLDRIQNDDELPGLVLNTLEARGVLLFRELHLDDEAQAAFCHRLGEVRLFPQSPIPEIFEISRRPGNPFSGYTEGAINWHIDGLIDQDLPTKATILSARVTAAEGGETAFASSYAAYDDLTEEEKEQFASLRVRSEEHTSELQ